MPINRLSLLCSVLSLSLSSLSFAQDTDSDGFYDTVENSGVFPVNNWTANDNAYTINGNSITFTGNDNWNGQIVSDVLPFDSTTDVEVSFTLASLSSPNTMFGIGIGDSSADFDDIEYAFNVNGSGLSIRESGTYITYVTQVSANDVLSIRVQGTTIDYRVNGSSVRTTTTSITEDWIVDSSHRRGTLALSDISVTATALTYTADRDNDTVANSDDRDSDNDGILDINESGLADQNNDGFIDDPVNDQGAAGFGLDTDGDGIPDFLDLESNNAANDGTDYDINTTSFGAFDTNNDGQVNSNDTDGGTDSDGNGVDDVFEDFDGDGQINSVDDDDDNDGVLDVNDDLPLDPTETTDTDGDGIGDNSDVFVNDPSEWSDGDSDGVGDNSDRDLDNDGLSNTSETDASVGIYEWTSNQAGHTSSDNNLSFTNTGVSGGELLSEPLPIQGSNQFTVSFTITELNAPQTWIGIGINDDDDTSTDIDYAFEIRSNNTLNITQRVEYSPGNFGTQYIAYVGPIDVLDTIAISVTNNIIEYWYNGSKIVLATDSTTTITDGWFIDSSHTSGAISYGDISVTANNYTITTDADNDGVNNSVDRDSDNDGILDIDESGYNDANGDGFIDDVLNDQEAAGFGIDSDGDGIPDYLDLESQNAANDGSNYDINSTSFSSFDTNNDGKVDSGDTNGGNDADNNGVDDLFEDFDGDGIINSLDDDDDNDGVLDVNDDLPFDPTESTDTDSDGFGDNSDAFPTDPTEWSDSDSDGVGDNSDIDSDNDGLADNVENNGTLELINWTATDTDHTVDRDSLSFTGSDGWNEQIVSDALLLSVGMNFSVSFTVDEFSSPQTVIGLAVNDDDNNRDDVEHAFFFSGTGVAVREGSNYRQYITTFAERDVFTIEIDGTTVNYILNGNVVYTSNTTITSGWIVDSSHNQGSISLSGLTLEYTDLSMSSDTDGDGIENAKDLDSDNDGILDLIENGFTDSDGDGFVSIGEQASGIPIDTDGDATIDAQDLSSNGATFDISATANAFLDTNNDGQLNSSDAFGGRDSNTNGLDDNLEDIDADGYTFPEDTFIYDGTELRDSDGDGIGDNADAAPNDTTNTSVATVYQCEVQEYDCQSPSFACLQITASDDDASFWSLATNGVNDTDTLRPFRFFSDFPLSADTNQYEVYSYDSSMNLTGIRQCSGDSGTDGSDNDITSETFEGFITVAPATNSSSCGAFAQSLDPLKTTYPLNITLVEAFNSWSDCDIEQLVQQLNQNWHTADIQFAVAELHRETTLPSSCDSSGFVDVSSYDNDSSAINIYIGDFYRTSCNYPTPIFPTPSTGQNIVLSAPPINSAFLEFDALFQLNHLMGRYLGLLATNDTFIGEELVDGSNCATSGDLVCDTPAAPSFASFPRFGCAYDSSAQDANDAFYTPDEFNIMIGSNYCSIAPDIAITAGQITRLNSLSTNLAGLTQSNRFSGTSASETVGACYITFDNQTDEDVTLNVVVGTNNINTRELGIGKSIRFSANENEIWSYSTDTLNNARVGIIDCPANYTVILGTDADRDGILNAADSDHDNDGTPDQYDAFPLDATGYRDTDGDGIADALDTEPLIAN